MVWSVLITAVGILFVFEGILPFLSPLYWRRVMQQVFAKSDHTLRMMGLISMLIGLGLVIIAHHL